MGSDVTGHAAVRMDWAHEAHVDDGDWIMENRLERSLRQGQHVDTEARRWSLMVVYEGVRSD